MTYCAAPSALRRAERVLAPLGPWQLEPIRRELTAMLTQLCLRESL